MTEKNDVVGDLFGNEAPLAVAPALKKARRPANLNSSGLDVPQPPSEDAVAGRLAELEAKLKQVEAEKRELESVTNSSLGAFEGQIRRLEQKKLAQASIMAEADTDLQEVVVAKDTTGSRVRTAFKETYKYWTPAQKEAKTEYDRIERELERLFTTLVAVTLVDDGESLGMGVPVGLNGNMIGLYYSTEYYSGKTVKTEKRVHLVPYAFYVTLKNSYKVKHRTVTDENGKRVRVPVKISPVAYAEMPTEAQLKTYKEAKKQKGMRLESDFS